MLNRLIFQVIGLARRPERWRPFTSNHLESNSRFGIGYQQTRVQVTYRANGSRKVPQEGARLYSVSIVISSG